MRWAPRDSPGDLAESALSSGMPLFSCDTNVAVSTVAVCARTGSRDETEGTYGTTHMLEHLLLRGDESRGERSLLVELGGEVNALTSKEEIVAYCRVSAKHALRALELLVGALAAAAPLAELERERMVVLEELAGVGSDPYEVAHDLVFERAFPSDGLGRPIGGTPDDVRALTVEALAVRHAQLLDASTLAVILTGRVDPEAAGERLERSRFGQLPRRVDVAGHRARPRCELGRRPVHVRRLRGDAAQVVIAAEGFSYADPRRPAAEVLATLIGGSSMSLLYRVLRDRLGLVYALWSDHRAFRDTGLFRVEVGSHRERVVEVAAAAMQATLDGLTRAWREDEVALASTQRAGQVVLESESSVDLAILIARNRFVGALADWDLGRHVAALESVTAGDVRAVAETIVARGLSACVAADVSPEALEETLTAIPHGVPHVGASGT